MAKTFKEENILPMPRKVEATILSEADMLYSSKLKPISEITKLDVKERDWLKDGDIVIFTNRFGHSKILKDRLGDEGREQIKQLQEQAKQQLLQEQAKQDGNNTGSES